MSTDVDTVTVGVDNQGVPVGFDTSATDGRQPRNLHPRQSLRSVQMDVHQHNIRRPELERAEYGRSRQPVTTIFILMTAPHETHAPLGIIEMATRVGRRRDAQIPVLLSGHRPEKRLAEGVRFARRPVDGGPLEGEGRGG